MSIYIHEKGAKALGIPYHDLPTKAVHLVRDPFDNLVARMHFGNDHLNLAVAYSNDEAGFREWCTYLDAIPEVKEAMELQLNVSWHNNAVAKFKSHEYPVMILYYEYYSVNYQATVDALFEFLELDQVEPPMEFIGNKSYHSYFSEKHKRLAADFVRQLATPDCWKVLQRYFALT